MVGTVEIGIPQSSYPSGTLSSSKSMIECSHGWTHVISHSRFQRYSVKVPSNALIAGGMNRQDIRWASMLLLGPHTHRKSQAAQDQTSWKPQIVSLRSSRVACRTICGAALVKTQEKQLYFWASGDRFHPRSTSQKKSSKQICFSVNERIQKSMNAQRSCRVKKEALTSPSS